MPTKTTGDENELERFRLAESGSFPDRLKSALHGVPSMRAFARSIGISDSVLRQYLSGRSEPTRPVLVALARAAKVDLLWLATGETSSQRKDMSPIPVEDLPVESMRAWLTEWWHSASQRERMWLQVEMERHFPEYVEWKKKTERSSSGQCGA